MDKIQSFMLGFATAIALSAGIVASIAPANAANTMSLVDEYRDGNQKVCVYSDGRHTATTTKSLAGSCPSKHTG